MSSSDVARSQRVLEKVGARLGLTEPGKQWLMAAVDPFHDVPLTVTGYPDVNEAASIVQVVKLSATIAVPSGIDGNWDCHFHQFPWMQPSYLVNGNWSNTNNGSQTTGYGSFLLGNSIVTPGGNTGSSSGNWGGLAVCAAASGQFTFQNGDPDSQILTPLATQLQPYLVGEYRIIGMGFEVINTTSELNIQGLCTVYRQPMPNIDAAKSVLVTSGFQTGGSTDTFKFGYPDVLQCDVPPTSTAECLLLDGTKQWKAKEGAYVVATLNSDEIPAGINNTTPILRYSPNDAIVAAGSAWGMLAPQVPPPAVFTNLTSTTTPPIVIGAFPTGTSFLSAFNHCGAYFSGLSNTTTLQVNATYYIEKFPSQQDSQLVVLARSSPRDDCIARELYSEIIREMPVGVPQRMNGMGEWFADAVSSAVDFIAPVASAIPLPFAQTIGQGLKVAGGIAKSLGSKKEATGLTYSAQGANTLVPVAKPKMMQKIVQMVQKKKKKVTKKK